MQCLILLEGKAVGVKKNNNNKLNYTKPRIKVKSSVALNVLGKLFHSYFLIAYN